MRTLKYKSRLLLLLLIFTSGFELSANELEFSGFARLIGGYLNEEHAEFKGYDNSLDFSPSSLLGLQLDYQANDKLSFTGQVILRADNDTDSSLEWLYLTYQPIEALQIKAGKLRTPFFALSDVTDVGFTYPWVNPPQQVYNAYLFRTFEGLDASYSFAGENFDASIEGYVGEYDGDLTFGVGKVDIEVKKMMGLIGKINFDNFEFRASRYGGDVNFKLAGVDILINTLASLGFSESVQSLKSDSDSNVTVSQIGLMYDHVNYFSRVEWVKIDTDTKIAPEIESYYITVGYNFSEFVFHLTFADSLSSSSQPSNEIPLGISPQLNQLHEAYNSFFSLSSRDDLQSWILGTRWDFRTNMALKFEYTLLKGEPGQSSFFTVKDDLAFDRKASLFQIGLEWVF